MDYLFHIAVLVGVYGILAISLNLLIGETGLVSVAQAAFAGVGAYAAALLMTAVDMNFFLAALIGSLLAGALAYPVGIVFLRLKEVYYVLGTTGLNVIVWSIFLNWSSLTGGPLGMPGIPRPEIFGYRLSTTASFMVLALLSLLAVYVISQYITRSSFGRVLRAIREDEDATAVFGYNVVHYKLAIFVIASCIAGYGGAILASYLSYISPQGYMVTESILILAMVILGGLGSTRGAILGAALLVILPELLRFVGFPNEIAGQTRLLVYGLVLIFFMLYRPQGIWGTFRI